MNRRRVAALFACSLLPMIIGNGVLPMLPGYAVRLGVPQAAVLLPQRGVYDGNQTIWPDRRVVPDPELWRAAHRRWAPLH